MAVTPPGYFVHRADAIEYEPMFIDGETGERVELKAGDIASFPKGTRSVWTFSEPFKKFTVISN